MKLERLVKKLKIEQIRGSEELEIGSIAFDSRCCQKGSLFVALKGSASDGHLFIEDAVKGGAVAVVCEDSSNVPESVTAIVVEESHTALGILASEFYNNPSYKIKVVGITGTNGKTTTVTLLYNLFTSLGYKCGLISTIENITAGRREVATHTTPDPVTLNSLMHGMVVAGCEYCFMEVSSHSLDQKRTEGIRFTGAIFSNITHDHLDYHKTFKEYIRVKKSFFDSLEKESFALTNIDDRNGEVMVQNCKAKIYTYSCISPADFNCRVVENTIDGMQVNICQKELWTRFIGKHNAYNLLAVYSAATLLGAEAQEVLVALSNLEAVSGRLEYIKGGENITAVVDYAHTPDALENVLNTLAQAANGAEIITVFGCGGNRDKTKRPRMAAVSAKYSTRVIVTSDNPRHEDPEEIIKDIKAGFERGQLSKTLFITDRREAIKTALITAKEGSIVLVAGKGHENYQEIKGVKHHFDDKEEITEIFNLMRQ